MIDYQRLDKGKNGEREDADQRVNLQTAGASFSDLVHCKVAIAKNNVYFKSTTLVDL